MELPKFVHIERHGFPRHANCLEYVGLTLVSEQLAIVTEFMDGGDLMARIHAARQSAQDFALAERASVLFQAAMGLEHIHMLGMCHRDIKVWFIQIGVVMSLLFFVFGFVLFAPSLADFQSIASLPFIPRFCHSPRFWGQPHNIFLSASTPVVAKVGDFGLTSANDALGSGAGSYTPRWAVIFWKRRRSVTSRSDGRLYFISVSPSLPILSTSQPGMLRPRCYRDDRSPPRRATCFRWA